MLDIDNNKQNEVDGDVNKQRHEDWNDFGSHVVGPSQMIAIFWRILLGVGEMYTCLVHLTEVLRLIIINNLSDGGNQEATIVYPINVIQNSIRDVKNINKAETNV